MIIALACVLRLCVWLVMCAGALGSDNVVEPVWTIYIKKEIYIYIYHVSFRKSTPVYYLKMQLHGISTFMVGPNPVHEFLSVRSWRPDTLRPTMFFMVPCFPWNQLEDYSQSNGSGLQIYRVCQFDNFTASHLEQATFELPRFQNTHACMNSHQNNAWTIFHRGGPGWLWSLWLLKHATACG